MPRTLHDTLHSATAVPRHAQHTIVSQTADREDSIMKEAFRPRNLASKRAEVIRVSLDALYPEGCAGGGIQYNTLHKSLRSAPALSAFSTIKSQSSSAIGKGLRRDQSQMGRRDKALSSDAVENFMGIEDSALKTQQTTAIYRPSLEPSLSVRSTDIPMQKMVPQNNDRQSSMMMQKQQTQTQLSLDATLDSSGGDGRQGTIGRQLIGRQLGLSSNQNDGSAVDRTEAQIATTRQDHLPLKRSMRQNLSIQPIVSDEVGGPGQGEMIDVDVRRLQKNTAKVSAITNAVEQLTDPGTLTRLTKQVHQIQNKQKHVSFALPDSETGGGPMTTTMSTNSGLLRSSPALPISAINHDVSEWTTSSATTPPPRLLQNRRHEELAADSALRIPSDPSVNNRQNLAASATPLLHRSPTISVETVDDSAGDMNDRPTANATAIKPYRNVDSATSGSNGSGNGVDRQSMDVSAENTVRSHHVFESVESNPVLSSVAQGRPSDMSAENSARAYHNFESVEATDGQRPTFSQLQREDALVVKANYRPTAPVAPDDWMGRTSAAAEALHGVGNNWMKPHAVR